MDNKQWKYQIRSGKMSVVLSCGMMLLFVGISIWLHKTGNQAYFIADIFSAIMIIIFVATVYRLIFYKVLIGKDGFYFQTHVGNGMYHNYGELRNAWITTGQNLSGHETSFCHFETADGNVTRFVFYFNERKAVKYLVKRTAEETADRTTEEEEHKHQHRIDGKASGLIGPISAVVTVGLVCIFEIPMFRLGGPALIMGIAGLLLAGYLLVTTIFTYFCFQVKIEEEGFYYQTTPFNGTYYLYKDIARCWEVKRVYRYRRSANRNHYFYLYFTDRYGKTRRFLYENDIFGYEVNILKERIGGK